MFFKLLKIEFSLANTQQGIAQLAVILILLASVGLGTYLVQQETQLFPQAKVCPEDEPECSTNDDDENPPPEEEENNDDENNDEEENLKAPIDGCGEKTRKDNECENGKELEIYYCEGNGEWIKNPTGKSCGDQKEEKPDEQQKSNPEERCKDLSGDAKDRCLDAENKKNPPSGSTNKDCSDKVTYCDGNKAIRKSGGYYDSDKKECVFDFYSVPELNGECKEGKDGDVVSEDPKKTAERDAERQRLANGGQPNKDKVCPSETKCKNNVKVRYLSFSDPQNPDTCLTETEVTTEACYKRDEKGQILKDKDGKAILAAEGDTLATSEQTQVDSLRADQLKQKTDLETEFARIARVNNDPTLLKNIDEAKTLLTEAQQDYEKCVTENKEDLEYCRTRTALKIDAATLKSRSTLYDAIEKGVPGVCVKSDFAVGSKAQNSLIEAKPEDGQGIASRVFMCTTNNKYKVANGKCVRGADNRCQADPNGQPVIQYLVRDSSGEPKLISPEDRVKLGFEQFTTTIPQDIKERRLRAEIATKPTTAEQQRQTAAGKAADEAVSKLPANASPNQKALAAAVAAREAIKTGGGSADEQNKAALSSAMAELMRADGNLTDAEAKQKAIDGLTATGTNNFNRASLTAIVGLPTQYAICKEKAGANCDNKSGAPNLRSPSPSPLVTARPSISPRPSPTIRASASVRPSTTPTTVTACNNSNASTKCPSSHPTCKTDGKCYNSLNQKYCPGGVCP